MQFAIYRISAMKGSFYRISIFLCLSLKFLKSTSGPSAPSKPLPEISLPSEEDFPPSDTEIPVDDAASDDEEETGETATLSADLKVFANRIGSLRQPGGVAEKMPSKTRETLKQMNKLVDVSTLYSISPDFCQDSISHV